MDFNFKSFVEKTFFGVFAYIGEKFALPVGKLRLYFIYISFLTLGSPLVFYIIAAFWLNLKRFTRKAYTRVFD